MILILLQLRKQNRGKSKVALHKFLLILWTVHACQMEYELAFSRIAIQLFLCGIHIIGKDVLIAPVLQFPN